MISSQSSLFQSIEAFTSLSVHHFLVVDRPLPLALGVQVQTEPENSVIGMLTSTDILR